MNLSLCTLTGVDERSNLERIANLSAQHGQAEWGFLYSPKLQGQPGRYPSVDFILHALDTLTPRANIALHVCGKGVTDLLEKEEVAQSLLVNVGKRAGGKRIQLNFNHLNKPIDVPALRNLISENPTITFITQQNEANAELWLALEGLANHAVLFDASGGRGLSPDVWPAPMPISCGYAGGLGVGNIAAQLHALDSLAPHSSHWVDMEGSLRDLDQDGHDWLNLDRCEAVLIIAQEFTEAKKAQA